MTGPERIAEHQNSAGEMVTIERVMAGPFRGGLLLVIHDDPPPRGSGVAAPMLLDSFTRAWLRRQLDALDEEDQT